MASGRGVAALPDWVVRDYEQKGWVVSRRLIAQNSNSAMTNPGLRRTLYAAVRQADEELGYMQGFLQLLIRMTQGR